MICGSVFRADGVTDVEYNLLLEINCMDKLDSTGSVVYMGGLRLEGAVPLLILVRVLSKVAKMTQSRGACRRIE